PTAGLPPLMRNWSEYVWLLNHMVETGFIRTIRELWWDVRPHHNFGTVEVRICDMPYDLPTAMGLTALIQCLVHDLSRKIDEGTYQFDCHPFMVRQNKWRACRYGMDANLVDPVSFKTKPVRRIVPELVQRLRPVAEELGCVSYLDSVLDVAARPTGSQLQLEAFEQTGDLAEVVRLMIPRSEL
ncbi:MAG: glutamate-cysteine ligase family protein, partial [Isosphaeraceae bacterium]